MQLVPGTPHATTPGSWSTATIKNETKRQTNCKQKKTNRQSINQETSSNNQSKLNKHHATRMTNELTCTVASINLVCSAGSIGTCAATPTSRNSVRDVLNASDSLWQTDELRVSSWGEDDWRNPIAQINWHACWKQNCAACDCRCAVLSHAAKD